MLYVALTRQALSEKIFLKTSWGTDGLRNPGMPAVPVATETTRYTGFPERRRILTLQLDMKEIADREKEFLKNAREGRTEDFGHIVLLYEGRLRAYASRFVSNRDDVGDIVQDAFLDALRYLSRYDPGRDFGAWIYAICKNRILNYFRSRRVRRSVQLSVVDEALEERMSTMDVEEDDGEDRVTAIRECMTKLRDEHRELISRRYGDRVAVKDIAEALRQSAASVSMRLMRLRDTLRRCLELRTGACCGKQIHGVVPEHQGQEDAADGP